MLYNISFFLWGGAKAISLSAFGQGEVSINANELSPGVYFYTLVVDGQIVNSRQMVVGN